MNAKGYFGYFWHLCWKWKKINKICEISHQNRKLHRVNSITCFSAGKLEISIWYIQMQFYHSSLISSGERDRKSFLSPKYTQIRRKTDCFLNEVKEKQVLFYQVVDSENEIMKYFIISLIEVDVLSIWCTLQLNNFHWENWIEVFNMKILGIVWYCREI